MLGVPCDWGHYLSRAVPPCASRADPHSRKLTGRRFTSLAEVPTPLPPHAAANRDRYADYFRHFDTLP